MMLHRHFEAQRMKAEQKPEKPAPKEEAPAKPKAKRGKKKE